MFQRESYLAALLCMILSMLCGEAWANTLRLCPGYRFLLFDWDYIGGLFSASIAWGMTLGGSGRTFLDDLLHADANHRLLAFAGRNISNAASLLLVTAIDIAGLTVAFRVGMGLALIAGAVSSYAITPTGNPWMLFGGVALVLGAIGFDPMAYPQREMERRAASRKGVVLCLGARILMEAFYPLVAKSMPGENTPGTYSISPIVAVGVIACSLPRSYPLMRKPFDGGARVYGRIHGRMAEMAFSEHF